MQGKGYSAAGYRVGGMSRRGDKEAQEFRLKR